MGDKRVLVVEDDTLTRKLLQQVLEQEGYSVAVANDGTDALDFLQENGLPHLIVLDLGLPTMHGFILSERIKRMGDVPIIILTGDDEEEHIIKGLQEYADDYITKPFNVREVVVRIQRVLSRVSDFSYSQLPILQIDSHLSIDFTHNRIILDGQPVVLTPIETGLLSVLIRHKGNIVPSALLIARVWPKEEVNEETLRVHMHRLRRKLHSNNTEYIHTERGVGYAFCFYLDNRV